MPKLSKLSKLSKHKKIKQVKNLPKMYLIFGALLIIIIFNTFFGSSALAKRLFGSYYREGLKKRVREGAANGEEDCKGEDCEEEDEEEDDEGEDDDA
jgi:hypothetical protein